MTVWLFRNVPSYVQDGRLGGVKTVRFAVLELPPPHPWKWNSMVTYTSHTDFFWIFGTFLPFSVVGGYR